MANEQPDEDLRVETCGVKYTYIMYHDGRSMALLYGEPWINFDNVRANNMVLALASDLDEARKEIKELHAMIEQGNMA